MVKDIKKNERRLGIDGEEKVIISREIYELVGKLRKIFIVRLHTIQTKLIMYTNAQHNLVEEVLYVNQYYG